jgi:hypothetical protein
MRLRKKAKTRLLTRAAQNGPCVFAVVYGAATARESVAEAFFRSLLGVAGLSSAAVLARNRGVSEIER